MGVVLHRDRRDQAEHAAESLAKGSRVVVVGRLQHDQLFANGKQVGDDVGSCVIAAITPQLLANCSLVIRLPEGNLAGQFVPSLTLQRAGCYRGDRHHHPRR
jgi:hypothetical protein